MVNYYHDMWQKCSEVLAPLTKLCSTITKFEWGEAQQAAFDQMKKIISREVLLVYPNFSQPFEIHTDASHMQLGVVILQNGRPIAFYSRKLNDAQKCYTTTERELLAIVETLKEYKNILLGQKVMVYTDHKNLTYKNFNTERVMRWRLVLEEFGPDLQYIKGEHNIVADAISRLDTDDHSAPQLAAMTTMVEQAEMFGSEKLPEGTFPLAYKVIQCFQQANKWLLNKLQKSDEYTLHTVCGGGKTCSLIMHNNKIVIPEPLQPRIIQWYHDQLCHPRVNHTESTIRQHFTFKDLSTKVKTSCKNVLHAKNAKNHT